MQPLISPSKLFKYSITFQETTEDSRELSDYSNSGYIIENESDIIGNILKKANQVYGIYYPIYFGGWESTYPEQDRDYFEKGVEKYYTLFVENEDGTDISTEEYDFITFLLSNGEYNSEDFQEYAVGGIVAGAVALGVAGLIGYYYFNKRKKGYPTGSAWTKEHYHDNEDEDYEVEPSKRKVPARNRKYVNGGGVSKSLYYIILKQGLTITNELDSDTFKTGIQNTDWAITTEQYEKLKNRETITIKGGNVSWSWKFKVTRDMVERIREIKTNDVEFNNGGGVGNYEMWDKDSSNRDNYFDNNDERNYEEEDEELPLATLKYEKKGIYTDVILYDDEDGEEYLYRINRFSLYKSQQEFEKDLKYMREMGRELEKIYKIEGDNTYEYAILYPYYPSKSEDFGVKYANGGKTEEVYIEFLNKEKGYKKDVKHFNSYKEAVEWARKNFDKFDYDMIKYKYANGGQIIRFDRHASMDSATRNELVEMLSYPFLLEYDVEENGEIKYDRIKSLLEREGVKVYSIKNYLSGLFDGYNYSNTDDFKKEMAKLKIADKEFYDRIIKVYEKISKYPKIDKMMDNGGNVSQTQLNAYRFVDEIVEIHKDKNKVRQVILDRVNSAFGRTSNQFVDKMWDRYNMIFYKEDYPHLFTNGGGVEKEKSLRHFILEQVSSGMIANKIPYSDYKTIDAIRFTALQILNRDGDREYSMKSFSDLIQEALLEYEENKYENKFANGGGVKKMYYHILEYGDYGNIGYQGYYETKEEAQKQVDKLSDYFPNQTFQIFVDNSKKEPPITTMNNGGGVENAEMPTRERTTITKPTTTPTTTPSKPDKNNPYKPKHKPKPKAKKYDFILIKK